MHIQEIFIYHCLPADMLYHGWTFPWSHEDIQCFVKTPYKYSTAVSLTIWLLFLSASWLHIFTIQISTDSAFSTREAKHSHRNHQWRWSHFQDLQWQMLVYIPLLNTPYLCDAGTAELFTGAPKPDDLRSNMGPIRVRVHVLKRLH